jgi:predicted porin
MFSGKEALGGGNAVLFKLENGFNANTGTNASATAYFDKQAFVGLQGDWGTLRAGRLYTPAFATLALVADPSGTYSVLTSTGLMESHGVRLNNGIVYNTPGFDPWTYRRSGWYGALAHYFGNAPTGGASRNAASGMNVGYGQGPLVVELSHQRTNLYTSATQDVDSHSTLLAANYDFGPVTGYVAYSDNSARNVVSTLKTKRSNDILLGVTVTAGAGLVTVVYIRKDDKLLANNDANLIGATYDYFLSKRTKLTAGYARIHNRNPAKPYKLANGYTGTTAANGGTSAVQLGLTHKF